MEILFLKKGRTYLVPIFNVKAKVNMEVLVMVVMENTIRLPRLPPGPLESYSRMINDTMVIGIQKNKGKWHYMMKILKVQNQLTMKHLLIEHAYPNEW